MQITEAAFGILMALISISSTVIIVMLITKTIQNGRATRERAFRAALEQGVYDPALIRSGGTPGTGAASLGWGIFFSMVGVALLIGFGVLGILGEAALGGLIPLAVGIGLILFHIIMRRNLKDMEHNGDPIRFDPKSTPTATMKVESGGPESLGD